MMRLCTINMFDSKVAIEPPVPFWYKNSSKIACGCSAVPIRHVKLVQNCKFSL